MSVTSRRRSLTLYSPFSSRSSRSVGERERRFGDLDDCMTVCETAVSCTGRHLRPWHAALPVQVNVWRIMTT